MMVMYLITAIETLRSRDLYRKFCDAMCFDLHKILAQEIANGSCSPSRISNWLSFEPSYVGNTRCCRPRRSAGATIRAKQTAVRQRSGGSYGKKNQHRRRFRKSAGPLAHPQDTICATDVLDPSSWLGHMVGYGVTGRAPY